jgi:peptidoglycan/xylan/chitin deacetylase (PgdA/CDA1 family)
MSARALARRVAYRSGWLGAMHRLRHRHALTVVTFHRVLATGDPRWATADPLYTVDADLFRACLQFFRRHYSPVSLEEVERGRLPARPLLVTLDDGWADSADTAAPLLREAHVPAVLFVASDTLRRAHAFWPERLIAAQRLGRLDPAALARAGATSELASVRALITRLTELSPAEREPLVEALAGPGEPRPWATAEQLRALDGCGVAIGAHSAHHEPLVRADDLEHELREPPAALAAVLGSPAPATLSFPHGAYDERVLERARTAGYRLLFTSDGSLNGLPAGDVVHRVGISADAVAGPGGRLAPDRLARCVFPCPVSRPRPRRGVRARAAAAVGALLAAAGLAACGESTPSPSPSPPPPPPASRFVSQAGSDSGSCRAASPCRSFDRAYQVARPGERVAVAAGSYPLQRIAPLVTPRGGDAVAFAPAAGARVRVQELVVDGSRVSFAGLRTGSWTAGPTAHRVTFLDVHVAGGIFITGARRVRVLGGSVGPGTNYSSEIKAAQPGGEPPRDVVIDGVRFHDWVRDNQEAHVDCLHVLAADGLVVRRSTFRNCEAFAVLLTGYGAAASPTNVLERNDIQCCRSGWAGVSLSSGHGESWRNVTVRRNRSTESYTVGEGTTAPGARVLFEGNSGPAPNPTICGLPGVRWADNTWSSGAPCGPGDRVTG